MSDSTLEHILIVGAGEFGLSTALALLHRPTFSKSRITILESSHILPNPIGSSVDASRIIRTDYASLPYARLASEAQVHWRDQTPMGWGGEGRYTETGFVLTADLGKESYVDGALSNVRFLATQKVDLDLDKIEQLDTPSAIKTATGHEGVSGQRGYANWNSGWAHAEKVVKYAIQKLAKEGAGRVVLQPASKVDKLLVSESQCKGVKLTTGEEITADLTILATGAWTPSLLDLEGRCLATGQALAYMDITDAEQKALENRPVIMNLSRGMFIIPPVDNELKIACHSYGWQDLVQVSFHDGQSKKVSVPKAGAEVPDDDVKALYEALELVVPSMKGRQFSRTRLCWYNDTPEGDFIIDYHPDLSNLLLATGGSGHGFKFFPTIGNKIVDRLTNQLDPALQELWKWPVKRDNFIGCEDGSRAGTYGKYLI